MVIEGRRRDTCIMMRSIHGSLRLINQHLSSKKKECYRLKDMCTRKGEEEAYTFTISQDSQAS